MKRLLIPVIVLFAAMAPALAQTDDTFQFVDKNGSVVSNGTTIVATELTEDEFLGNNINCGLQVKNMSGATAHVRMVYEVSTIDNGSVQVCFPVTCNSQFQQGVYETAAGPMDSGEVRDLQSEWFPLAYGQCVVSYRIELMKQVGFFPRQSYEKVADGPTVSVVFRYDDPAAIAAVERSTKQHAQRFDLLGRKHTSLPWRGLTIIDGRKVFMR